MAGVVDLRYKATSNEKIRELRKNIENLHNTMEVINRGDFYSFFSKNDYEGERFVHYHNPSDNPTNLKKIEALYGEAEQLKEYICSIADELKGVYEAYEEQMKNTPTELIVDITKTKDKIYVTCGDYDPEKHAFLKVHDSCGYYWAGRGEITNHLLELNNKYGVNKCIVTGYTLTKAAQKVFSEYHAA